jgi:hypothetical protein
MFDAHSRLRMAKLGVVEWIALVDKNDNFDWHFDEGLSLDLVCGIWNVGSPGYYTFEQMDNYKPEESRRLVRQISVAELQH